MLRMVFKKIFQSFKTKTCIESSISLVEIAKPPVWRPRLERKGNSAIVLTKMAELIGKVRSIYLLEDSIKARTWMAQLYVRV